MRVLGATSTACPGDGPTDGPAAARIERANTMLIATLTALCDADVQLDLIINVFAGNPRWTLPPCVINTSSVPGSKYSFWRNVLTPEVAHSYDIIWHFDNDLLPAQLSLGFVFRAFIESGASLVQPCIVPHPLANGRATDISHLRCNGALHRCKRFPSKSTCYIRSSDFVEVMTPIFTRRAWVRMHELLVTLPSELLQLAYRNRDQGPDRTFCPLFAKHLGGSYASKRHACGVMCMPLQHANFKQIEYEGYNKRHANGSMDLSTVDDSLFKATREKYPKLFKWGTPRMGHWTCLLDRKNATAGLRALEANATVVDRMDAWHKKTWDNHKATGTGLMPPLAEPRAAKSSVSSKVHANAPTDEAILSARPT